MKKHQNEKIDKNAYIVRECVITGDVTIGEESSVLYYAAIRADNAPIRIGKRSNIQEQCSLHTDPDYELVIGDGVTVGRGCLIGAGSLVTENTVIPDGCLALGRPAKPVRALSEDNIALIRESAAEYVETGRRICEQEKTEEGEEKERL